jgi:predicted permease
VALVACVIFGLAPAMRATRTAPGMAMKTGSRTTTDGRERFAVRRALVVLQVALSLVLVVGALLFVRTLRNLTHLDPGFRQDGILVAGLDYRKAGIDPTTIPAIDRRILEQLRALPGVDAVAQVFTTPVSGSFWNDHVVVGGKEQDGNVNFNSVGTEYFRAFATPLVAGRDFSEHDTPQSGKVAIVSESFARTYFPGRSAIGQSFQIAGPVGDPRPMIEIVGVARDTKYADLREAFTPIVYTAIAQGEEPDNAPSFVLHATTALPGVRAGVTRVLAEINPAIAVQYQTVRGQVQGSLLRERLMATLSGFFGGLAVLIATVGLYGVMAYTVTRRRVEIGIRMALGATRGAVVRMIVREAGALLAAGVFIGAALSLLAARAATTLLYELTPSDPATILAAAVALGTVTIAASCIPAWRASRLEPTRALRED